MRFRAHTKLIRTASFSLNQALTKEPLESSKITIEEHIIYQN